jgi:hypothetical protein
VRRLDAAFFLLFRLCDLPSGNDPLTDPKRAKVQRGGARVVYLHVPEANRFYMLDVYGKDVKDDLSPDEKKRLRELAEQLKKEAIASSVRREKGGKRHGDEGTEIAL